MKTITGHRERDSLIRELSGGDLDEDLARHLERLRRFFFKPWSVLDELYLSPGADPSKLRSWRQAPPHSPEHSKADAHDRALDMIAFWLGLPSGVPPED